MNLLAPIFLQSSIEYKQAESTIRIEEYGVMFDSKE